MFSNFIQFRDQKNEVTLNNYKKFQLFKNLHFPYLIDFNLYICRNK